jgi:hypothetical protein
MPHNAGCKADGGFSMLMRPSFSLSFFFFFQLRVTAASWAARLSFVSPQSLAR